MDKHSAGKTSTNYYNYYNYKLVLTGTNFFQTYKHSAGKIVQTSTNYYNEYCYKLQGVPEKSLQ